MYDAYAEECFTAKDWGIPLPEWFKYDRQARAAMIATRTALSRINSHLSRED